MSNMETIVFTNGCFDIIHPGHIDLLKQARALGTKLIVGINSDRSVREIKGTARPFLNQEARAAVLRELRSVDEVRIFDENTPERLIREINPHVLVKGGDWQPGQIIGADFVLENGGRVLSIPFKQDISSSQIVEKILSAVVSPTGEIAGTEILSISADLNNEQLEEPGSGQLPEMANIQRAGQIISEVLAQKGRVLIAGIPENWQGAQQLAESFAQCLGINNRVELSSTDDENELSATDLLIGVSDNIQSEEFGDRIMKARRLGCRVIIIAGVAGRKLAALSDVGILIQAENESELLRRQAAVEQYWCHLIA